MDMETNKVLGALLVAGIIAMLAGFVSHVVIAPKELEENAYQVDASAVTALAAGGAAAPAVAEPIKDFLPKADVAHGEKVAKVCAACHTFGRGEPNRIGPNLAGVIGRSVGAAAGFAYSDAMKVKGGSWSEGSLNEFLWNPKKFVAGTKMTFAGLKKPEDRAALIKWMATKK